VSTCSPGQRRADQYPTDTSTPRTAAAPARAATYPATGARSIVEDWATTHRTDVTQLTLACGPDHKLVEVGWTTRKRANGDTEWLSPPHLDYGQPRTNTFYPEKLFCDGDVGLTPFGGHRVRRLVPSE
jgi:hypothetical protein